MPHPLYLATAIEAVVRAGQLQMARLGTALTVTKKGEIDLVTEVDLEVERMLRDLIAERFPGHVVLAEELGEAAGPPGAPCWIFDPIDGTTNFAHGLPIFCASLALELDGRLVVGAVYDPSREELFTAERGQGARLNGVPLSVSPTRCLADALLVTGFPYDVKRRIGDLVGLFGEFLEQSRAVRRLGSAALDLCYVAAGRLDGYWEQSLHAWDTAAGALLVEEAGGQVTGIDGKPFDVRSGHLIASNGRIHEGMLATVRSFYAGRTRNRTD
ncbi:MAG: inositol monophosphatase [Acidobacteria bacterium]|nr:inositol monophosphatase [Acidobacteriota bacterium]